MLTAEQQKLWDQMGMDDVQVSGNQTEAQARNLAVDSYLYACSLEGIPEPDEADLQELLR